MRRRPAASVPPLVPAALMFAALLLAGCGSPAGPPATSGAATAPGATSGAPAPGTTQPGTQGTQGAASPGAASETETESTPGTAPGTTTPATSPPSGAAPSSSAWKTFTTSDGTLSFDYPAAWVIRDPAGEAPLGGEFVDVVNAAGKQMAALRTNVVTGAECGDQQPYMLIDSEPMQALAEPGAADQNVPRYVFEGRGDVTAAKASPPTYASYGITMMPEVTEPVSCPMFQLFLWPPSGALFGQTYDPANNTTPGDPGLPYLEKAKLYATTAEYQDVRRMITSLRPAAKDATSGAATEPAK
ncbi:hypothetical protein AB4089_14740 [Arthrobacter sp. 2MCAF15]|uniref:hypothetical protein n=1 Tax=Arthrobacter sp. 2MCAF15 TaxID=3232984 RepID=UPI003F90EC54